MKYISLFIILIFSSNIISAQIKLGPLGFEPTAVELDSNEVIWIGTGSSGGVFRCNMRTNLCEELNKPFGPANITWLQKIENRVFVNADSKYYVFREKSKSWTHILDSTVVKKLIDLENNYFSNEVKKLDQSISHRKFKVPKFINSIKILDNNSAIISSKFGVYKLDLISGKLMELNFKINAADIFQVLKCYNGNLVVLAHDRSIYAYKSNKWIKLFSHKEYDSVALFSNIFKYNERESYKLDSNIYENGYISAFKNKVLYTVDNKIFRINLETGIADTLNSPFSSNLVCSYYFGDTLVSFGNLKRYSNYFTYNRSNYFAKKWETTNERLESYKLPLFMQDSSCGRSKEVMSSLGQQYLKPFIGNDRYYYNDNSINNKVLSFFFDKQYLYLGTSGSGLLRIKRK